MPQTDVLVAARAGLVLSTPGQPLERVGITADCHGGARAAEHPDRRVKKRRD